MTEQVEIKEKTPIPEVTPEKARQLEEESRALRDAYHQRVIKMWVITPDERQAKSR